MKSLASAIGRNGLMEAMNSFGMDSPFTQLQTDSKGSDPDEFYSLVPYEKGYLFVALLEQAAGVGMGYGNLVVTLADEAGEMFFQRATTTHQQDDVAIELTG